MNLALTTDESRIRSNGTHRIILRGSLHGISGLVDHIRIEDDGMYLLGKNCQPRSPYQSYNVEETTHEHHAEAAVAQSNG